MKLTILTLLVSGVVAQGPLFIPQGPLQKSRVPLRSPQNALRITTLAHGRANGESVAAYNSEQSLPKYTEQYSVSRRTLGALLGAGVLSFGNGWPALAEDDTYGIGNGGAVIPVISFVGEGSSHTWPRDAYNPKSDKALTFKGEIKAGKPKVISTADDKTPWPDLSSCEGFSFYAKNTGPYSGYSFSFGKGGTFKAKLEIPEKEGFSETLVPFTLFANSKGERPTEFDEENLKQVSFSAEGGSGKFSLAVKQIDAYGCKRADQIPAIKVDEASVEGTSDASSWLLAAASAGFLVFLVLRTRSRPAPIAPLLLG